MLAEKPQTTFTPSEISVAIQLPSGMVLTDEFAYLFVTLADNFRADQAPISKCRFDAAYYATSPFPQHPMQHLFNRLQHQIEGEGMRIVTVDDPEKKRRDNTHRSAVALFVPRGIEPIYTVPEGSVFLTSIPLPEGHPALPAKNPYRDTCEALVEANPKVFDALAVWTVDTLSDLVMEIDRALVNPNKRGISARGYYFTIDRSNEVEISQIGDELRVLIDAVFLIHGIKYHQRNKRPVSLPHDQKKVRLADFQKAIETVIADMIDYTPDYHRQNPDTNHPLALWSHTRAYLRALKMLK